MTMFPVSCTCIISYNNGQTGPSMIYKQTGCRTRAGIQDERNLVGTPTNKGCLDTRFEFKNGEPTRNPKMHVAAV